MFKLFKNHKKAPVQPVKNPGVVLEKSLRCVNKKPVNKHCWPKVKILTEMHRLSIHLSPGITGLSTTR
jgi:hypothetical protein